MLRDERDYLLRMIAAAAATVARLRQRLSSGGSATEIAQAARAAQSELLGKDAALLRAVDPATAAQILGGVDRLPAWIDLLRVEGEALRADGKVAEADAIDARAQALDKRK